MKAQVLDLLGLPPNHRLLFHRRGRLFGLVRATTRFGPSPPNPSGPYQRRTRAVPSLEGRF